MWCNEDAKPKLGNPNESSEMLSNYRGGTTASARVLYKRLKIWKFISGSVGRKTHTKEVGDARRQGLGQDVDLVVFASDYFFKGLYTRIKTGVTEDYGLQWDK